MKDCKKFILPAILLLAAALRLVGLNQYPASLYWEEVALGYDAYSILKTGKDFHGNPWPLVAFESFGDYKPSGYFYTLVPFVAIIGLNEWAVRIPSALAGIATVWLVYLLVIELKGKREVGWLSALTLAILPWHIQFSRAGFEVTLATFLLVLGILWFLKARKNSRYLILSALVLVLSMYTYHGLRVVAPLMALMLIGLNFKRWYRDKFLYISVVLAIGLSIPLLSAFSEPVIQQRFAETSRFPDSPAVSITNQLRLEDGNTLLARLLHHRYWYWGEEIVAGSLSHFTPGFLFVDGDYNQRHQTGMFALLYPWMVVPLLIGLYGLTKNKYRHLAWIIGWILIVTIPIALTKTTPHTLRFLPASPAFAMVIGIGMAEVWYWLRKVKYSRVLLFFGGVVVFGSVIIYTYDYVSRYTKQSSQDWQYGYKQVITELQDLYDNYENIYFSREYGRPSMYVLFYSVYNPDEIQLEAKSVEKDQGELLPFDRYQFEEANNQSTGLYVSHEKLPAGELLKTINFLDGKPAFYIYEL